MNIPQEFRRTIKHVYPPNNSKIFEEWFFERYNPSDNKSGREYIPIFPTSYQVNANYGRDSGKMRQLQRVFDKLDRSKKYFIIAQYDDGIKANLNGLDVTVCGMGGGRIDLPLPLTCMPHPYTETSLKHIFASFQGALTHPIREELLRVLKNNSRYLVSAKKVSIQEYVRNIQASTFVLCPRGYGKSSFRIAEALQWGAIPVYISDEFIFPFNVDFNEYGYAIHHNQIGNLDEILSDIPLCDVHKKRQAGKKAYAEIYSYEGCYQMLMKHLCPVA